MGRAFKVGIAIAALLCAVAIVALHAWRAAEAGAGTWTAGDADAATADASRRVAWRAPGPHPRGSIAADGPVSRVAFAPDGRRAVLARGARGHDAVLWLAEQDDAGVVVERPLLEVDAPGDELAPWFDGATLWFASDRPGGCGGLDLWRASFADGRFGRPEPLARGANSPADDTDPTVHGSLLVFASDRGGAGFDLWSSELGGADARRIDALSAPTDEREPAFAPDGGSLWYASRADGSFDLARAFRAGDRWLSPEIVAPLASAADERSPCPGADGFEIAFLRPGSERPLWRARSVELGLVPALPWTLAEVLLLASLLALSVLAWLARDVSRYDTLIAAWALSVLVHVVLLLLFGDLRLAGAERGARDDGGPRIRVRVAPDDGGAGIASARGANRLERADTRIEVASAPLVAAADLSARIAAPAGPLLVPGRDAAIPPASAPSRSVADAETAAIPRAALAEPGSELPEPGRTVRAQPAAGESAPPRRFEHGAAGAVPGSSLPSGSTLALERAPAATPIAARAAVRSGTRTGEPLALDDSEPLGEPAVATLQQGGDALAALAPEGRVRALAPPALERHESARASPAPDVEPSTTTLVDAYAQPKDVDPAPSRLAATPYERRTGPAKQRALEELGGTPETEAAVAKGLAYLARIQGRLGQWGPLEARDEKYGEVCVGKTALATLAFLAAGHTHASGTEHSRTVQRALAFLLAVQDPATGHYGDTSAYSHGIATFALAEALAMTRDESLRASVERAVAHLLARQSRDRDPRKSGGWPYYYADEDRTFDPWPRTSITAWQVLALESARLSGVPVPDAAFDAAARFLEAARDERAGWYRYSHEPARLRSAYPTLPASTPAALFALSCTGRDISGPEHAEARQYVLERAPRGYRFTGERDFVQRGQGNPYFWYQGTLAMLRVGGSAWRRWNVALQETLLPAQESDGSWRPIDVYARYARDDEGDRAYTTALCVLCLEAYYRYDLPLLSAARPAAGPR